MATRSRIGLELENGSILSIYCHYDGYPEHNGVKLKEHFSTRNKVSELIDGGDISSLWTNTGWQNETLSITGPLYYSARGEDCPPHLDNSLQEYLSDGEEYAYVFTKKDEWVCYNMYQFNKLKKPELTKIPCEALKKVV
jgi:hypothetical protein